MYTTHQPGGIEWVALEGYEVKRIKTTQGASKENLFENSYGEGPLAFRRSVCRSELVIASDLSVTPHWAASIG